MEDSTVGIGSSSPSIARAFCARCIRTFAGITAFVPASSAVNTGAGQRSYIFGTVSWISGIEPMYLRVLLILMGAFGIWFVGKQVANFVLFGRQGLAMAGRQSLNDPSTVISERLGWKLEGLAFIVVIVFIFGLTYFVTLSYGGIV